METANEKTHATQAYGLSIYEQAMALKAMCDSSQLCPRYMTEFPADCPFDGVGVCRGRSTVSGWEQFLKARAIPQPKGHAAATGGAA